MPLPTRPSRSKMASNGLRLPSLRTVCCATVSVVESCMDELDDDPPSDI